MNGQMKSFKEKQRIVDNFIARVKPYEKITPLKFDLRGYSAYLKEHNIPGNNVPEHVMKMFQR